MTWRGPTYRVVDGEMVDGVWRHVWCRSWSGGYHVEDLLVFADGTIRCERVTDISSLTRQLAAGRISPTDPSARRVVPETSKWSSRRSEPLTHESFVLEVVDQIEALNGRPTTVDRCWEAIDRYREDPSEPHRISLRQAYLRIPRHLRAHVLGDMELQDRPLRILSTEVGHAVDGDGPVVTPFMHQQALDYFLRRQEPAPIPTDFNTSITIEPSASSEWPTDTGLLVLRNEHPSPITLDGQSYPSVATAFQLNTDAVPLSLMADLLRAKFTQHPQLAEVLLATEDARLNYVDSSSFWGAHGRNWLGRLLELIRSELLAGSRPHRPET
ncbi:DUF1768 domain-containing protein [Streptomyces sp. NPDC012888]|uniref:DUF7639 domain-containing protein n=1 Tax=Streptomyces sp. NPDC012888 TaxID=3364855 RepID=UPI0036C61B24